MFADGDDGDCAVGEEEERGEDATAADPVPQDLRMIDCVSEEQEPETPRDRRQTNEVRRAEITGRAEPIRQDDLGLERAGHEEDPESRQDEGEAGSVPLRAHATAYHAAPPSTFAEIDRSPLPHLLFALPAAHPLLAPLPAHLSALLPSPRRAFHRVAGRRVTPCRISSFPSPFPEGTWCRHVGEQIYRGAGAPKNPATATSLGYEVAYRTFPGPP